MAIGARIRAARKAKGWRLRQLAAACQVAESYLSEIELGKIANPGSDRIVQIAAALDVTPNDLMLEPQPQQEK